MRSTCYFFLLILIVPVKASSQSHSDLYSHVDSLIRYEIKYTFDETTDQLPDFKWDSTKSAAPHFSTFPQNPSPLIILDENLIRRQDLDAHSLKEVADIEVHGKGDRKMMVLYGEQGRNGLVIIRTKAFKRKRR